MERKFHGKTRAEMNGVLDYMCLLKDKMNIKDDKEEENFTIAIQCIATITSRMADNKPLAWD